MLKGLQLGELARLRAFWAADQSPQRPQPCASLSIPTRAGSTERCVASQEPQNLTIVFFFFLASVPFRILPFILSLYCLLTQRLSVSLKM